MLNFLNQRCDPHDRHHIVRMRDYFLHRRHLCLVFELLSLNLYELVKHNQFRGLSMNLLRVFLSQVRRSCCTAPGVLLLVSVGFCFVFGVGELTLCLYLWLGGVCSEVAGCGMVGFQLYGASFFSHGVQGTEA